MLSDLAEEMLRSFSKARFTRSLQELIPEVGAEDLEPSPAGVRAQALRLHAVDSQAEQGGNERPF